MAIILKEIAPKFANIHIEMVAGFDGAVTPVTWVHVVETAAIAPFIDTGELAFMTGLALGGDDEFLALVQDIHCYGASGLIVNFGPYIQEIPSAVLAFCNRARFPLMTAPWAVSLSSIMRVLTMEITTLNLKDMELELALKRAILSPSDQTAYLSQLSQHQVDVDKDFACVVLELEEPQLERLKTVLQTHLRYAFKTLAVLGVYEKLVLVVPHATRPFLGDIVTFCQRTLEAEPHLRLSIGPIITGVTQLHESYEKALVFLGMRLSQSVVFYDDMGLMTLLAEVGNPQALERFYYQSIGALVHHDQLNKTALISILRLYLQHNGSVKAVAEQTYLHRNTVNYQLGKIEDILGVNLSELSVRVNLTIGLTIYDMNQ